MKQEERIEELLARYFAAGTTPAEERELREHFARAEQVPPQWRSLQTLFRGLDALSQERMPDCDTSDAVERMADKNTLCPIDARPSGPMPGSSEPFPVSGRTHRTKPYWWGAAAAAIVLGAVLGARLLREPYCYIDGVAVYDKRTALQTTAYLDGLSRLDDPVRMVDELIENNR